MRKLRNMAKERGYFPRELFHKTDRLPRRRCPECVYTHQGKDEVCEVCRAKAEVTKGKADERLG